MPLQNGSLYGSLGPAVSPDGRHVAFVAMSRGKAQIWIGDLDSLSARALPGSGGSGSAFWSPDSRFIAFVADGKLRKSDIAGAQVVPLCDAAVSSIRGASWGRERRDSIHPDPVLAALPRLRLRRIAGSRHRTGQGEPGNQPPLALVSSRRTSLSLHGANPGTGKVCHLCGRPRVEGAAAAAVYCG
jgi:hypothetical protein